MTLSDTMGPLVAGGIAGTAVDTLLFPLDTLKTRLQSAQGFKAAGGFNGVYRGLSSAISGSAPSAAAFFMTYETLKIRLRREDSLSLPAIHMMAASGGEITACIVRVPTEVVKQRLQTGLYGASLAKALSSIWKAEGIFGYYRGYGMTLFREIPFTCIQFPLYEFLKSEGRMITGQKLDPVQAGLCGSLAGGLAAAVTTPLDVVKTRLMLSTSTSNQRRLGIVATATQICTKEGPKAFFKGIVPRVTWISIGGSIFLGVYEAASNVLNG